MRKFLLSFLLFIPTFFVIGEDETPSNLINDPTEPTISSEIVKQTNDVSQDTSSPDTNVQKGKEETPETICDLRPAVPLAHSYGFYIAVFFGIFIVILLLIIFLKHFLRSKKPVSIPISPYAKALLDLEKTIQWIQGEDQKVFLFALTDAVRIYLSAIFLLPAPESTTEELLEKLPICEPMNDELRANITTFLQQCDLGKFTQTYFDYPVRVKLYQTAKDIIQTADKLIQKAESITSETNDTNVRI